MRNMIVAAALVLSSSLAAAGPAQGQQNLVGVKGGPIVSDLGASEEQDAGRFVLTGDARYDLGVTNLDESGADGSVKNRAWEFLIGLGLPIGH